MSRIREFNNGKVSVLNSTAVTLDPGETFTGDWEDVTEFVESRVAVFSNVASATDGLSIEYSTDGTNDDHSDTYTYPGGVGKNYLVQRVAQYYRIVYTNGGTIQALFRLTTIFNRTHGVSSSHRLDDDITTEDDGVLGISILKTVGSDPATFHTVDSQHPLPTDGDSLYLKDIDAVNSDNGGFSGVVTDYFDSLKTVNNDASATNPKTIKVWFNRTTKMRSLGFGCDDLTKSFSNIKFQALGSGEEVRFTKDESTDSTKRNSYLLRLPNIALNGFIVSFHTTDEIGLSNLWMPKTIDTNSVISAVKDNGEVVDIGATNNDNLRVSINEYGDTPAVDAFARLRTSEPFTLFDSKQLHDKQPLLWDESIGGSATSVHVPADANTVMTVTASASDFVIRQTKQRFNYQPGKSQLVFMTFNSGQVSGVTTRVGTFDGTGANNLTPNNGIFFESDGSISWNIAKNGSIAETAIQANWNVDKLDGTGASGITLDLTAAQILIIDYEWLGVGRVRVGFVIDGLVFYCHYFNHANDSTFDSVYMSTPNLPMRYSIETDGTNGGTLDQICSTIMSEGGVEEIGVLRSADMGVTHVDANAAGTTYAMVGIRLKAAYLDVTVTPVNISVMTLTNDSFRWQLILNPTVAGTFTYSDLANSAVQTATGATANTVTSGIVIGSGYVSKASDSSSELETALRMGSTIAGVFDTLVLCATPISSNADLIGSLTFRELL